MLCLVYVLRYLPFGKIYNSIKEFVTKVTSSVSNTCKKCCKKKDEKDPGDFETSEVYHEKGGKATFTKRFSLLLGGVGTATVVAGEECKEETVNPLHRENQSSKGQPSASSNSGKKQKRLRLKKKFNRAVDKAKEQINKIKVPKVQLPSMSRVMLKVTTGI